MKKILIAILLAIAVYFAGCCCKKEQAKMEEPASPAPAMAAPSPCATAVATKHAQSYPVSTMGGSIRLEKIIPEQVNANAPFEYRIDVTNLTDNELKNVMVTDKVSADLAYENSTPDMQRRDDGTVVWNLGSLEPKGSRTISVRAIAKSPGAISTCAEVSYDCPTCTKIAVVEPMLSLTRSAPSEILACDRLPIKYVIKNTGTGAACNVSINEKLPAGLQTAQGENSIAFSMESLGPGESREFDAMVDATKPGMYSGMATASAADIPSVNSGAANTIVNKPVLAINSTFPAQQYIGRAMSYDITVKNTGDGIAQDAVIVASVPDNAKFMSATDGGNFTHMSPGKVTWNIGALAPNESKTVRMELSSDEIGEVASTTTANAKCAEAVSNAGQTKVAGIAAILLETVDNPDPVELGQNVTYTITITNQGSAMDTAIRMNCMLEQGMEYVSSSGPTKGTLSGSTISFEPLTSLSPKEKAVWKLVIKAVSAGDMRLKTVLTSDQMSRPAEKTEPTTFYK
jgi:uncharacterized repeat protein (TIGR01451 family)